ncbi:hypothetical protein F5Y10DRAFT_240177 [Nemania abortiva]|nr:hypothetical protein F5Y10DRAFT_240177 [Nemania abortiva]
MNNLYDAGKAQRLVNKGVEIDLCPHDSGELKTTVLDNLGTIEKTGYSICFQRLYEVHGQWNDGKPDDASLLAIKMIPCTAKAEDYFKSLSITMTLELSKDARSNQEGPYFASYEPGQEGAMFIKEVSHTVTTSKEAEGNLGAQLPGGADLGLTLSKSTSEEFQRRLIHKVEAKEEWSATGNANRKRTNRIRWTLTSAEQSDGIGDYAIIAFLIRRSRATKFRINVESEAKINLKVDTVNSLLPMGRKVILGDFGPANATDQLKPDGVKETNLEQVADQNSLRDIAFIHLPERVAPRSVYNSTYGSTATVSTTNALAAATPVKSATNMQAAASSTAGIQLAPEQERGTFPATTSPLMRGLTCSVCHMTLERGTTARANSHCRANNRAIRHRRMAALYRRLAQLHMEEADDSDGIPIMESYADEVERQDYI